MRRAPSLRAVVLACATLGVACFERANPAYCDGTPTSCPTGQTCDAARHACVAATGDGGSDGPIAVDASGLEGGGGCTSSATCAAATPICDATSHTCGACSDDAACKARDQKTPRGAGGLCVECASDGDCGGQTPICEGHACRACRGGGECAATLVCAPDGSCAGASDVLYVDNKACGGAPDGSAKNPFCQVQDAVGALAGQHYVHVAGSSTAYNAITIGRSVTLIGPGGEAKPTAQLFSAGSAGVTVMGSGTVVLDGFEVIGGALKKGVQCLTSGTLELRLYRSYVHASGDVGVSSSGCKLVMDEDKIGPNNQGGGIIAAMATFDIENSFIVGNGTGGIAVSLQSTTGIFRHNTVASNLSISGIGGISCGGQPQPIEYSLIWGNTQSGGTSLSGMCRLSYSDIDEAAPGTGNVDQAPTFMSSTNGDYHLATPNPCCIDRIGANVGDPVTHDYDAEPRPQGNGWDIGADEVVP